MLYAKFKKNVLNAFLRYCIHKNAMDIRIEVQMIENLHQYCLHTTFYQRRIVLCTILFGKC